MKQYSESEIQELLLVSGGNEADQAAALAVVISSIRESRRLGRIALGAPKSTWNRNHSTLRANLDGTWQSGSRSR
jgi:hypothetical protein